MNSPLSKNRDPNLLLSQRPERGSPGWSLPLGGWELALLCGSLLLGAWGGHLLTWAQEAEQQPEPEVSLPVRDIDPAVQIRVRNELVKLCGENRCESYRFPVRVLVRPEDTLGTLLERLDAEMLREVDRVFQTRPDLNRVIVDGYVFVGTPSFASREVLLQTLFVPRHRWAVGRFGPEQDGIFYAELLEQVTPFLTQPPTPTPPPEAVPEEPVPPLPPTPAPIETPTPTPETPTPAPPMETPTPTPQATPEAPPPPGGVIERQPIQP
jgi:hypothetical protein